MAKSISLTRLDNDLEESDHQKFFSLCNVARYFYEEFDSRPIGYSMACMAVDYSNRVFFFGDKNGDISRYDLNEILKTQYIENCGFTKVISLKREASALAIIQTKDGSKDSIFLAVGGNDGEVRIFDYGGKTEKAPIYFEGHSGSPVINIFQPRKAGPVFISRANGSLTVCEIDMGERGPCIKNKCFQVLPDMGVTAIGAGGSYLWFGDKIGNIWVSKISESMNANEVASAIGNSHNRPSYCRPASSIKRLLNILPIIPPKPNDLDKENFNLSLDTDMTFIALAGSRLFCLRLHHSENESSQYLEVSENDLPENFLDMDIQHFERLEDRIYAVGVTQDARIFWQQLKPNEKNIENVFANRNIYIRLSTWAKGILMFPLKKRGGDEALGAYMILASGDRRLVFMKVFNENEKTEDVEYFFESIVDRIEGRGFDYLKRLELLRALARRHHGHKIGEKRVQWAILRLLTDSIRNKKIIVEGIKEVKAFKRCLGWLFSNGDLSFCQTMARRLTFLVRGGLLGHEGIVVVFEIIEEINTYLISGYSFSKKRMCLLELIRETKKCGNTFDAKLYASIVRKQRYDMEWEKNLRPLLRSISLKTISFAKLNETSVDPLLSNGNKYKHFFACGTSDGRVHLFDDYKNYYEISFCKNIEGFDNIVPVFKQINYIIRAGQNVYFFSNDCMFVRLPLSKIFALFNSSKIQTEFPERLNVAPVKLKFNDGTSALLTSVEAISINSFALGTNEGNIYLHSNKNEEVDLLCSLDEKICVGRAINCMSCVEYHDDNFLFVGTQSGYVELFYVTSCWTVKKIGGFLYDNQGISSLLVDERNGFLILIVCSKGGSTHSYSVDIDVVLKKGIEFFPVVISGYKSPMPIQNIKSIKDEVKIWGEKAFYMAGSMDGNFYILNSEGDIQTSIRLIAPELEKENSFDSIFQQDKYYPIFDFFQIPATQSQSDLCCETRIVGVSSNGHAFCFRLIALNNLKKATSFDIKNENNLSKDDQEYNAAKSMGLWEIEPAFSREIVGNLLETTSSNNDLLTKLERLLDRGEYFADTSLLMAHIRILMDKRRLIEVFTKDRERISVTIKRIIKEWGDPGGPIQNRTHLFMARKLFKENLNELLRLTSFEGQSQEVFIKTLNELLNYFINNSSNYIRFLIYRYIENYFTNSKSMLESSNFGWLIKSLLEPLTGLEESEISPDWIILSIIRILCVITIKTDICPMLLAYQLRRSASEYPSLVTLLTTITIFKCKKLYGSEDAILSSRASHIRDVYGMLYNVNKSLKNNRILTGEHLLALTQKCKDFPCPSVEKSDFHYPFISVFYAFAQFLSMVSFDDFQYKGKTISTACSIQTEYYTNSIPLLIEFNDFKNRVVAYVDKVTSIRSSLAELVAVDDVGLLIDLRRRISVLEANVLGKTGPISYLERDILIKVVKNWKDLIQEECRGDSLIRFQQWIRYEAESMEKELNYNPYSNRKMDLTSLFMDLFDRFILRLDPEYASFIYWDKKDQCLLDIRYEDLRRIPKESVPDFYAGQFKVKAILERIFSAGAFGLRKSDPEIESLQNIFTGVCGGVTRVFPLVMGDTSFGFPGVCLFWKQTGILGWPAQSDTVLLSSLPPFVLANDALLTATRKLGVTFQNMFRMGAHQMKTPLMSMRYKIDEVLSKGYISPGSQEFKDYTSKIKGHVDDALTNVNNLLNVRKLFDNNSLSEISMQVESQVDLYETIEETIGEVRDIYRTTPVIICFNRKILAWRFRAFTINTDRTKVKDIIRNLLTNACKYSIAIYRKRNPKTREKPKVIVDLHFIKKTGGAVVTVSDNGPGISFEDIDRVTQPFWRTSFAESNNIDGYGVGLFIAEKYALLLGGRLTILNKSGPEEGIKARLEISNLPIVNFN